MMIETEEDSSVKQCYLVTEKKIVSKLCTKSALFILFSSFYVFNINYPIGCYNFYIFFEHLFLKKKITGRKPRLTALLADLEV